MIRQRAAASHTCNEQGIWKGIKSLCRNSLRQNHFSKIVWRHCELKVIDFPKEEAAQDMRQKQGLWRADRTRKRLVRDDYH